MGFYFREFLIIAFALWFHTHCSKLDLIVIEEHSFNRVLHFYSKYLFITPIKHKSYNLHDMGFNCFDWRYAFRSRFQMDFLGMSFFLNFPFVSLSNVDIHPCFCLCVVKNQIIQINNYFSLLQLIKQSIIFSRIRNFEWKSRSHIFHLWHGYKSACMSVTATDYYWTLIDFAFDVVTIERQW